VLPHDPLPHETLGFRGVNGVPCGMPQNNPSLPHLPGAQASLRDPPVRPCFPQCPVCYFSSLFSDTCSRRQCDVNNVMFADDDVMFGVCASFECMLFPPGDETGEDSPRKGVSGTSSSSYPTVKSFLRRFHSRAGTGRPACTSPAADAPSRDPSCACSLAQARMHLCLEAPPAWSSPESRDSPSFLLPIFVQHRHSDRDTSCACVSSFRSTLDDLSELLGSFFAELSLVDYGPPQVPALCPRGPLLSSWPSAPSWPDLTPG